MVLGELIGYLPHPQPLPVDGEGSFVGTFVALFPGLYLKKNLAYFESLDLLLARKGGLRLYRFPIAPNLANRLEPSKAKGIAPHGFANCLLKSRLSR